MDIQFEKKTSSGEPNGSRIFGDCDVFMRELMKNVFTVEELNVWEKDRDERMKKYNKQRDTT